MFAQLADHLAAGLGRRGRQGVFADGDDARNDRNDLREVVVKGRCRDGTSHARQDTLDGVDD